MPRQRGCGPEFVALKSRSGRLKLYQKLCRRRDIDERLFRRKPDSNLIYERTAVFERRLSLGFLEHDCASIQPCLDVTRRLKATGIFWTRHNVSPAGVISRGFK